MCQKEVNRIQTRLQSVQGWQQPQVPKINILLNASYSQSLFLENAKSNVLTNTLDFKTKRFKIVFV